MKLLVMSDNHGNMRDVETVLEREHDTKNIFHCGDYEGPQSMIDQHMIHIVRGNSIRDNKYNVNMAFQLTEAVKIFMTHGHQYGVKWSLNNLFYTAKELKANVVFYGHTHVLNVMQVEGIVFINSGSLSRPRGQMSKTYVMIEVTNNKLTVIAKRVADGFVLSTEEFEI